MIKQKIQITENVPNPSATELIFYPKGDGYYYKDSNGVEHSMGMLPPATFTRAEALALINLNQLVPGRFYFLSDIHVMLTALTNSSFAIDGYLIDSYSSGPGCLIGIDEIKEGAILHSLVIADIDLLSGDISFATLNKTDAANLIADAINANFERTNFYCLSGLGYLLLMFIPNSNELNGESIIITADNISFTGIPDLVLSEGVDNASVFCLCKYTINTEIYGDTELNGFFHEILEPISKNKIINTLSVFLNSGIYSGMNYNYLYGGGSNVTFKDSNVGYFLMSSTTQMKNCIFDHCNIQVIFLVNSNLTNCTFFENELNFDVLSDSIIKDSYFFQTKWGGSEISSLNLSYDDRLHHGCMYSHADLSGNLETVLGYLPKFFFIYKCIANFGDLDDASEFRIGTSDQDDCIMGGKNGADIKNTRAILSDMTLIAASNDCIPVVIKSDNAQSKGAVCSFKFCFSK